MQDDIEFESPFVGDPTLAGMPQLSSAPPDLSASMIAPEALALLRYIPHMPTLQAVADPTYRNVVRDNLRQGANVASFNALDAYERGKSPFEYATDTATSVAGGVGQVPKHVFEAFGGEMPYGRQIDEMSARNPVASAATQLVLLPPAIRGGLAAAGSLPRAAAATAAGTYGLTSSPKTADATRDKDFESIVQAHLSAGETNETQRLRAAVDAAQRRIEQASGMRVEGSRQIGAKTAAVAQAQAAYDAAVADLRADEAGRLDAARRHAGGIMAGRAEGRASAQSVRDKAPPTAQQMYNRVTADIPGAPPLSVLPLLFGLGVGGSAWGKATKAQEASKEAASIVNRARQLEGAGRIADAGRTLTDAAALRQAYGGLMPSKAMVGAGVGGGTLAAAQVGYDGMTQPTMNPEHDARANYAEALLREDPTKAEATLAAQRVDRDNPAAVEAKNPFTYITKGGFGMLEGLGGYKLMATPIHAYRQPDFKDVKAGLAAFDARNPGARAPIPTLGDQLLALLPGRKAAAPVGAVTPVAGGIVKGANYPAAGTPERQMLRDAYSRTMQDTQGPVDVAKFRQEIDHIAKRVGFQTPDPARRIGASNAEAADYLRRTGSVPVGPAQQGTVFQNTKTLGIAGAAGAGAAALTGSGSDAEAATAAVLDAILDRHDLPGGKSNPAAVGEAVKALREQGIKATAYQVRRMMMERGARFD